MTPSPTPNLPTSDQLIASTVHMLRTLGGRARVGGVRTVMLAPMFCATEAEAELIHAAFHRGGELSAAVELRRLYPGLADSADLRSIARAILGWAPLPAAPADDDAPEPRTRTTPRRGSRAGCRHVVRPRSLQAPVWATLYSARPTHALPPTAPPGRHLQPDGG